MRYSTHVGRDASGSESGACPDALKALIVAQHDELIATHEQLRSRESEIEHPKLLIAKLRRMQFGR